MKVSLSIQILILTIATLSFISVSILCEFAMLPDMHILSSQQEEQVHYSSWGYRCTHLEAYSSKSLSHLSVIILVCPDNTYKIRLQDKLLQLNYSGYFDTKKHFTLLQFQYSWDFNKYLWAIFSQLCFENFWLYRLSEVAMTQNY